MRTKILGYLLLSALLLASSSLSTEAISVRRGAQPPLLGKSGLLLFSEALDHPCLCKLACLSRHLKCRHFAELVTWMVGRDRSSSRALLYGSLTVAYAMHVLFLRHITLRYHWVQELQCFMLMMYLQRASTPAAGILPQQDHPASSGRQLKGTVLDFKCCDCTGSADSLGKH